LAKSLPGQKKKILVSESYFCRFFIDGLGWETGDYDLEAVILSTKSFFCRGNTNRNSEVSRHVLIKGFYLIIKIILSA